MGVIDNEKFLTLGKVVKDIKNYYFQEKKGELYEFLISATEKFLIETVLNETEGNQLKAAKILGINRNTLHAKIRKLEIKVNDFKNFKDFEERRSGYM